LEVLEVSTDDFAPATALFRQLESRAEWGRTDSTAGTGAQTGIACEADEEIPAANSMAM
jgi:hypothetical protein